MDIPELQSTSQRNNVSAQGLFTLDLMQAPSKLSHEVAESHPLPNQSRQSAGGHASGAYSSSRFNLSELSLSLEETFKRIDKDQDGLLTYTEMAEAVRDPSIKGKDALVLAILKSGQTDQLDNAISLMVLDKDPHKGVTLRDAKAYFGLLGMAQQANCSVGELYGNIARAFAKKEFQEQLFPMNLELDPSRVSSSFGPWAFATSKALSLQDKKISQLSLVAASRSDKFDKLEKSVINLMLRNREFFCSLEPADKDPNAISIFDLRCLTTMAGTASLIEKQTWGIVQRDAVNSNPSLELFAQQDKAIDSIKPEAIRQGSIGDCYFLAAVGTVAAHSPEFLSKMIRTTESGGYKVKFPGAGGKEVIVEAPTETELLLYAEATKYGTWVAILEKAYAKLLAENPEYRPPVYQLKGSPPENIGLGGLHEGLAMLTGTTPERIKLESSPKQIDGLRQRLALGMKNGEIAMAASKLDTSIKPDFVSAHAYTVLDYDEKSVTLRNPWGVLRLDSKDGLPFANEADKGIIKLSLEDFCDKFHLIYLTPKMKPVKK